MTQSRPEPKVIVIPAKEESPQDQEKKKNLRVAAYCRVSTVLRAKRETDLARIMSILPCLHWRIMRRKSLRLQAEVPVMPSSAKISAIVQSGFAMIFSV